MTAGNRLAQDPTSGYDEEMTESPTPTDAKEKILQAATKVFAEQGFGGARIDQIAASAGVNKAALYYHVGDKETLYVTIMSRVVDEMLESLQAVLDDDRGPAENFRSAIRAIARRATDDPCFAPLMLHEIASGGTVLPGEIVHKFSRVFSTVGAILREGVSTGVFRKVDPVLTHMMAAGGLLFLTAGTPLRERIRAELDGEGAEQEKSSEQLADQVSAMLLDGLLEER